MSQCDLHASNGLGKGGKREVLAEIGNDLSVLQKGTANTTTYIKHLYD